MSWDFLLLLLLMGLVTYLPRALPLLGLSRARLPGWVEAALRYVGIAVLAALLAPDLAAGWGDAEGAIGGVGPRALAAVPAFLAAWATRSLALTVLVGVLAYAALLRLA